MNDEKPRPPSEESSRGGLLQCGKVYGGPVASAITWISLALQLA